MDNYLTPKQAAARLGVTRSRIYNMIREGVLVRHRIGEFTFVTVASVEARSAEAAASAERIGSDKGDGRCQG